MTSSSVQALEQFSDPQSKVPLKALDVADVDGALARMGGSTAEVIMAPTVMPWGNRSALLRDPDGSLVNIFSRPMAPPTQAA